VFIRFVFTRLALQSVYDSFIAYKRARMDQIRALFLILAIKFKLKRMFGKIKPTVELRNGVQIANSLRLITKIISKACSEPKAKFIFL
jgi:hypothetical protein